MYYICNLWTCCPNCCGNPVADLGQSMVNRHTYMGESMLESVGLHRHTDDTLLLVNCTYMLRFCQYFFSRKRCLRRRSRKEFSDVNGLSRLLDLSCSWSTWGKKKKSRKLDSKKKIWVATAAAAGTLSSVDRHRKRKLMDRTTAWTTDTTTLVAVGASTRMWCSPAPWRCSPTWGRTSTSRWGR